jgi:uncharacterized protein involved in exopolysaccharide biosynthesis
MTLIFTPLMPIQYQSEMNVLVQNARGNLQVTPERTMGRVVVNEVTEEQINSEIEVLRSRSLAKVVVDPHSVLLGVLGFMVWMFASMSLAQMD